jgi:hypothetical protein
MQVVLLNESTCIWDTKYQLGVDSRFADKPVSLSANVEPKSSATFNLTLKMPADVGGDSIHITLYKNNGGPSFGVTGLSVQVLNLTPTKSP